MDNTTSLTETEIRQFVDTWFHSLDIHVPLEAFLDMVEDEGIEFRFPEVTVTDKKGLTEWYNRVTKTFFDEVHQLMNLSIMIDKNGATLNLTTHWQASTWNPPAPKSERIDFLAGQTWTVRRSTKTKKLVVVQYIVNSFDPVGSSGSLPSQDGTHAR